jgi:protein-disulfide isomerase
MEKKPWYKKWWGILLLLLLMLSIATSFAFSLALLSVLKQGKQSYDDSNTSFNNEVNKSELSLIEGSSSNYWFGDSNPKVTIVEFSDFACPYCKKSFTKIREISKKYKDVKIIFRDLPIITDYSTNLALSARCAGEQGLFWVMHDKLFINQGAKTDEEIFRLAKEIGVNEKRFKSCYNSKKYFEDIEKDFNDAKALGITTGTPVWFINGQKASGDIPYDLFIEIVEKMLDENT